MARPESVGLTHSNKKKYRRGRKGRGGKPEEGQKQGKFFLIFSLRSQRPLRLDLYLNDSTLPESALYASAPKRDRDVRQRAQRRDIQFVAQI